MVRYVHTNIAARDWKLLADFYCDVLGCVRVGHERDLSGADVDAGVGVPGARIRGVHLLLPGHGASGPTLEIFRYDPSVADGTAPSIRRPGLGHLAFGVDDVASTRARVLAAGGRAVGELVRTMSGAKVVEWCYVTDPEGNGIELQRWESAAPAP